MNKVLSLVVLSLLLCSCSGPKDTQDSSAENGPKVQEALCVLRGTVGNEGIQGWVRFEVTNAGTLITAEVSGLTPGSHGFHVHATGDINCDDGTCTGGHFNPEKVDHGLSDAMTRHVGDMGNLIADENGVASYKQTDTLIRLNGPHSVVGRGIIVHEKPDDGGQPTGNAGARQAMGVIGIVRTM